MSYEEILEKIKKAKALADSKKVEAGIQDKDITKLEKIPKAQDPNLRITNIVLLLKIGQNQQI